MALLWPCTGLKELAVAAAIDPESGFDEGMRLTTSADILEICGSFIKKALNLIELAHISVSEFLTSKIFPDGSPNEYYISKYHANLLLQANFS